jgi:catechol-2,3-dioxygenase
MRAEGFVALLRRWTADLTADRMPIRVKPVDHGLSWCISCSDPDGNRIEVTSYDHQAVGGALRSEHA